VTSGVDLSLGDYWPEWGFKNMLFGRNMTKGAASQIKPVSARTKEFPVHVDPKWHPRRTTTLPDIS
jgi:hypothetical protein